MYDILVGNEPTSPIQRRTAMDELYGRYHGRILVLAARSTEDGAWKAKLREILAEFDDDCRELSAADNRLLRYELASQIEHGLDHRAFGNAGASAKALRVRLY